MRVTHFSDPGCPWAFSAEPFKRRLQWLYGDCVEWMPRMVVLSESPEDYDAKGLSTTVATTRAGSASRVRFTTGCQAP